jgi:hypothetical protein
MVLLNKVMKCITSAVRGESCGMVGRSILCAGELVDQGACNIDYGLQGNIRFIDFGRL